MRKVLFSILVFVLCFSLASLGTAQERKIYWGSEVPGGWNGDWPENLKTPVEKTDFARTADNRDILDFFAALKWQSENVHVFNMFVSDRGRSCPVIVMANPRITSAPGPKFRQDGGLPTGGHSSQRV